MLKSELLEIIANGESSGVEFKRDDTRPPISFDNIPPKKIQKKKQKEESRCSPVTASIYFRQTIYSAVFLL